MRAKANRTVKAKERTGHALLRWPALMLLWWRCQAEPACSLIGKLAICPSLLLELRLQFRVRLIGCHSLEFHRVLKVLHMPGSPGARALVHR
jgi:hypothetical protein